MFEEALTDTERKPGRKPKPQDEKRSEKISIYLTPQLAKDIRDLAFLSRQDLSEVFIKLVAAFVDRNRDKLEQGRRNLQELGTIE